MFSERTAMLATANLLAGLIQKLQESGALTPDAARSLVNDIANKMSLDATLPDAEVKTFLNALFPGAVPN